MITRRTLLTLIPGGLLAADVKQKPKTHGLPPAHGEFIRFADRVTENTVVRLTQPTNASVLPARENRFVSSREGFLVFSSDRTGVFAPFRANLKTGVVTQLATTKKLQAQSPSMDWRERELWLIDDGVLISIDIQRAKSRKVTDGVAEFHLAGRKNNLVVRRENKLERWTPQGSSLLADGVSSRGIVGPSGNGCIFSREETPGEKELWFAPFTSEKPRLLAKGKISSAYWRPDSEAVLFLRNVDRGAYLASELRETALDGSAEHLVAQTSQYAVFAPNGDGSVFVGASRSKAQPDIVLLLRSVGREMVLCEHRARRAESVSPVFSPNSQRVYFQSDHEGKFALYSVNVERLVEQTEDDAG